MPWRGWQALPMNANSDDTLAFQYWTKYRGTFSLAVESCCSSYRNRIYRCNIPKNTIISIIWITNILWSTNSMEYQYSIKIDTPMQYNTGNCIYMEYNIDHSAFRPLLAGTNDLYLHFKDLVCYSIKVDYEVIMKYSFIIKSLASCNHFGDVYIVTCNACDIGIGAETDLFSQYPKGVYIRFSFLFLYLFLCKMPLFGGSRAHT
jgi:hypothetical protein